MNIVVLDNNANILSKYNKNKLVPFGEFLPYENFFKKLGFKKITQGYLSFSSSDKRHVININSFNFTNHTQQLNITFLRFPYTSHSPI